MRTKIDSTRSGQGFTLVEMIGVLAIIAVLVGILLPKVFTAVARGKVNSTAATLNNLKTATTDYFTQNSSFPQRRGTGATNAPVATGRFDADLLARGFVDKLVSVPLGSQLNDGSALTGRTHVRSQTALNTAGVSVTPQAGGDNFNLDGNTSTADFSTANTIVSLFIPGVATADAIALNALVDGVTNVDTASDIKGRCIYSTETDGTVSVYLYVVHQ